MSLNREYSTYIAFLGASRTTLAPCPPTQRSYLGSYQYFNQRSLEKNSGTLLQILESYEKINRIASNVCLFSVFCNCQEYPENLDFFSRALAIGSQEKKWLDCIAKNKYKGLGTRMKQSVCPGCWKTMRLPALKHPDASHWLKGGGNQNDPLSNTRSQNHLRKKCTYLHFSSPVRLEVKPPPCLTRCGLPQRCCQHLQLGSSADPTVQDLVVSGVTVPLARTGQVRRPKMEIHVYVPSGKKRANAESLDEGFLEETDKLSMLSLVDSIP